MSITKRWELLNLLAEKIKAVDYLEIGVQNIHRNFSKINVQRKVCVDTDRNAKATFTGTSDSFFHKNSKKFDLIFIDGMHTKEQVRKDFDNAFKVLNGNGYIVLHDCNPPSEETTCIPRGAQREWCGDVYKFACSLSGYDGINYCTVDMDYGCCVIWKDGTVTGKKTKEVTWEVFIKNKTKLLRLFSVDEFINL